jgi:hypothetical protein
MYIETPSADPFNDYPVFKQEGINEIYETGIPDFNSFRDAYLILVLF